MLITQSQVDLSASHQSRVTRSQHESLLLFQVGADGQAQQTVAIGDSRLSLSAQAVALASRVEAQDNDLREHFDQDKAATPPATGETAAAEGDLTVNVDAETLMIKSIIEYITGKRLRLFDTGELQGAKTQPEATPAPAATTSDADTGSQLGMRYQRTESYTEEEAIAFGARARIETADGRTLALNLDLQMSRSFAEQNHLSIEAGARLKDPLVINFGTGGTRLTDERVEFDLDADGYRDSIAFVDANSGLLALDKNGDGRINDGGELFGAISGNGFADLAALDEDGNGFIDEGDSGFGELKIWVREAGEDRLMVLADQGIGALYLGYTDTPFELKDSQNQLLGRIRATGVYLTESGQGGTLQQIDLVT